MDNNNPPVQPGAGTAPNPPQPVAGVNPVPDPTLTAQPAAGGAPVSAQPGAVPNVVPNLTQPGTPANGGGNKKLMLIVVGLVALVAVFAGVYFFMSRQASTPTTQAPATQTAAPVDTLDEDLESLTIEELDADFAPIDLDLGSL